MSEWQPIETAPKDGTVIELTWFGQNGEPEEIWPMRWGHIQRNGLFPDSVGMWVMPNGEATWNDADPDGAPTHWRALSMIKATGCTCDFSRGTRGMDRCGRCDGTGSRLVIVVDGQAQYFPNTKAGHDRAEAALKTTPETMSAARYSREQKAEIVRRYLAGEDRHKLAREFGCHHTYPDLLTRRRFHGAAPAPHKTATEHQR